MGISLCCFCFCVVLSLSMAYGDLMSSCMEVRNVTIIPYVNVILGDIDIEPSIEEELNAFAMQLKYLVKSVLETPCFIVWAFSPIESRLIRLTEENYANFLETDLQAITQTDENEVMKVLVNMPHNNNDNKQTIFHVYCEYS